MHLWIGGTGLARGYFAQPALTAERFIGDPFVAGQRMYRTGDLARWRSDGRLEHLGRSDSQVKVRGFRIELAEIEHALRTLPDIREAAVVAPETPGGGRTLVAFVVYRGDDPGAEPVVRALKQRLPDYMVPSFVVPVAELPRTPNGKLDRQALAARPVEAASGGTVVAPQTAAEIAVAEIWREVLGRAEIGVHDNFFQLGGHSLLATQVISRLRSRYDVALPIRSIFDAPTLGQLAQLLPPLGDAPAHTPSNEGSPDPATLSAADCADLSDAEVEAALAALLGSASSRSPVA